MVYKGDRRYAYSVLAGRPDGMRPFRRPRTKWEENIAMSVQDLGQRGMGWNALSHDRVRWQRLVNAVINFWSS